MRKQKNNDTLAGQKEKVDLWELAVFAACIGFYMIFPLMDGPVWCVDSREYVSMGITREPLYPCFLALCRKIAALLRVDGLMTAVVFQSLFAGIAAWFVGHTARRIKNGSRILELAAVLFQFAVTLLCRFAANRSSAYSDCILTESLAFPLFLFFSVYLFLYLYKEEKKYLGLTFVSSFLLISLRKQMMITLLIWGGGNSLACTS